jgi:L-lactate dehydrogenase complex protein LldF
VRKSSLVEALYCIRCGACLNICPVFRELGGHAYVGIHGEGSTYPGPIGAVLSPALFGQSEFGQFARASSLCGACREACPVDIDLPKLLLRVRAGAVDGKPGQAAPANGSKKPVPNAPGYLSFGLRIFTWIATSPWRFAAAQQMAGLFSRLLAPREPWLRLPGFTGWGASKDFPRPTAHTFHERWAKHQRQPTAQPNAQSVSASAEERDPVSLSGAIQDESANRQALVEQFSTELRALGGFVTVCQASALAGHILDLLQQKGIHQVQAWDGSQLPAGLLDGLRSSGIQIISQRDPSILAGLTGADGAIAESGTLLITGALDRPLTASLVPEIHMSVLRLSTIHAHLPEVLKLPELQRSRAAALISGPSRTADIEMTLTVGMHGPKEIHVFCLEDC